MCRLGFSGANRANDRIVFSDRGAYLAAQHAYVESLVALCLRLDGRMQTGKAWAGADGDVALVESFIEILEERVVGAGLLPFFAELLIQSAQISDQRTAHRCRQPCSPFRGQGLEFAHDMEQLTRIFLGERGNDGARLLQARREQHVSFLLQPLESGPHRGSTDVQSRRDVDLDEPRAGSYLSTHDECTKLLVHLRRTAVGQRLRRRRWRAARARATGTNGSG